ncbi:kinase-like domain-containing protein [Xylariaceae sp. FL0662B]|nr:kinase-like domain-containing protein [Xylariaceae sp. FL0662B]
MPSAPSTEPSALSTPSPSSIYPAPQEILRNVGCALAKELTKWLKTQTVTSQSPTTTAESSDDQPQPQPKDKTSPISPSPQASPQARNPRNECILDALDLRGFDGVRQVRLLAQGGYNSVWLVDHAPLKIIVPDTGTDSGSAMVDQFILRLPSEYVLGPHQVANEVAFRRFIASKLPHIPVPKVYYYEVTDHFTTSFIIEEFIDAKPLSQQWMSLNLLQKEGIAQQLAVIITDLAGIEFDMIGGLEPVGLTSAPTVEACKISKGRQKFHREECYPIGPYKTTKEYILACYDKEIYYYTHGAEDIDMDFFTETSVESFVTTLRKKRDVLAKAEIVDEPFVLIHGDFHGRNILARDGQLVAILDWEFAGSYPLSETLPAGTIDVTELENDEECDESVAWGRKIQGLIRHTAAYRGWSPEKIDMLMGYENKEQRYETTELINARFEMVPQYTDPPYTNAEESETEDSGVEESETEDSAWRNWTQKVRAWKDRVWNSAKTRLRHALSLIPTSKIRRFSRGRDAHWGTGTW